MTKHLEQHNLNDKSRSIMIISSVTIQYSLNVYYSRISRKLTIFKQLLAGLRNYWKGKS